MRMLRRTLFLALLAVVPNAASAQSAGRLPRLLELPASTSAMALGGAYMMSSGQADAIFYHPALLAKASGFGLDLQTWSGEATAASASAATSWFGGGVGIGLQTLQYGGGATGGTILPAGEDVLFDVGTPATSERVASLGYAHELFGVQVGVTGKLVEERVDRARESAGAFDVGVARELGRFTFGFTAANLGQDLHFASGDAGLPARYTLGVGAYPRPLGPLDVGVAAQVGRRDDGETVAGAGLQFGYWPVIGRTFVGRVGLQRVPEGEGNPVTFGFAYWGDDLVLEWAYRSFGALGEGTHRFGVRWR